MKLLDPGAIIVIVLYLVMLFVILWVAPRWSEASERSEAPPLWRNVRFWASFVAVAQILIYAIWG